ncbi:apolipoprotein R-like [Centruroides sculpturatus]|uniref:apolipoprotein R-like n=1 Tax=Centruroides sculpturatus TaxID=218467 RepID=UPI000C6D0B87|nr:apolipoprotein R-like [Centruroides sculpturatus]
MAIICRPPPSILRGHLNLTSQSTAYGSQVVYECDVGYKLVGDSILICGDSGDWEGKIPTCYAHPKGMDGKRSQTKRPSLFSSRLNMGGIIALGVFGGFVFLAVAITIIVIIVRSSTSKTRIRPQPWWNVPCRPNPELGYLSFYR